MRRIEIYDTTLRDGMQREGMSVSVDEKVQIALKLDRLGVHYIEGGFPGSNPKDVEFYRRMASQKLRTARLAAFGMTRKRGVKAHQDSLLKELLKVDTPVVTIVGKSWKLHTQKVLRVGLEENLSMIEDTVAYLTRKGREVFYDAEHFFDGFRDDDVYALATLKAAAGAGATRIVLCDTNGATLPGAAAEVVRRVADEVDVPIGIHAHNDADCAVAVSLVAVEAGATQVQGTVNGYGERCGNANLISVIPALKLKMGMDCLSDRRLTELTETAHFVAEICNVSPETHQPYVGENAFAHKGGLHVSAALKDARTFEHIDPALVGNEQRILVSELAGRATLLKKATEMGIDLAQDKESLGRLLKRLKEKEHQGYHYEAADASLELFLRRELGLHKPIIELDNFRIIVQKRKRAVISEAKIVMKGGEGTRGDEHLIAFAEGNGPVNALDIALRKLLPTRFPRLVEELSHIHLVNYKVRILNEYKGTGAVTRVLLDSSDGHDSWGTVGVSENIIEASWEALVDSIEYGLIKKRRRK